MARLQKKKKATDKKIDKKTDKKIESAKKTQSSTPMEKGSGGTPPARPADVSGRLRKKSPSARKPALKPKSGMAKKETVFQKAMQFLREVQLELKKVVWPSRKQTINSTVVVIIFSMICSFFLGFVDICLSFVLKLIL